MVPYSPFLSCSHDSDLVGEIKGILLLRDNNVGLLESIWSDEGVYSGDLDFVEILAGLLDHGLVGSSVNDEYQSVVVLNGFDGALSAQWVLYDGEHVPGLFLLNGVTDILGLSSKSKSLWSSEGGVGPHLVLSNSVTALLH